MIVELVDAANTKFLDKTQEDQRRRTKSAYDTKVDIRSLSGSRAISFLYS